MIPIQTKEREINPALKKRALEALKREAAEIALQRIQEQERKRNPYEKYQDDPLGFCQDVLGETFTPDVEKVVNSVRDNVVTIARSANSVGKSHAAARIALWFYLCFPDAKVFTTAAPPLKNLKNILWGEIGGVVMRQADLFADHTLTTLRIKRNDESFLDGIAIPTSGSEAERESKFSGKHAPHMLFIVDEADAVPAEVYRGIESCMSGGHVRLLLMFNPKHKAGPVYLKERNREGHVVPLSAFNHPNVITGLNLIPGAVDRETTLRRMNEWTRSLFEEETPDHECYQVPAFLVGETARSLAGELYPPMEAGYRKVQNPAFFYMVLGLYPAQAEGALISEVWIEAARRRYDEHVGRLGERSSAGAAPVLGMDAAEKGGDWNAVALRYSDGFVAPLTVWRGLDGHQNANRLLRICQEVRPEIALTDGDGVGSSLAPTLNAQGRPHGIIARGVKAAQSPTPHIHTELGEFRYMRDQLWWALREWLRTAEDAMLPPDETLLEELRVPTYHVNAHGYIEVMKKDEMRKLLRRSPDRADALCLTFAPFRPAKVRRLYG